MVICAGTSTSTKSRDFFMYLAKQIDADVFQQTFKVVDRFLICLWKVMIHFPRNLYAKKCSIMKKVVFFLLLCSGYIFLLKKMMIVCICHILVAVRLISNGVGH